MSNTILFPIFVRQGKSRTRYKVGYIDREGCVVIKPIFSEGTRFYEGLAAVAVKGRWGIINANGDFIIPPTLWNWCRFEDGLARLANRIGKWGVINIEGNFVVQPKYDYLGPVRDGRALFRIGELAKARFGYVNGKGAEEIPAVFHGASGFSEGLAAAKVGNLWGYIDTSGVFRITPRFEASRQGPKRIEDTNAGYFVNGLAPVWLGEGYGFIDTAGTVIIDGVFNEANSFHEERALIEQHKRFGFIDRKGSMVVEPRFTLARDFSEGLARVRVDEPTSGFSPPSGFIDSSGSMILEPVFYSANSFQDGLCLVETKDSIGYIDKLGQFVWQGDYVEYGVVL